MDNIFDHYKKTGYLHHAHIIEGAYDEVAPDIIDALARHIGIEVKNNPDLTVAFYVSLGINEARALSDMQTRHPFGDTHLNDEVGRARKFFIVGAKSFTPEAQNALLKTFEDPTAGTHFFIILPRADTILATLKSRVTITDGRRTSISNDETKDLAEKFLNSTLAERFASIKKITEHKKGESVDRDLIRRMLDHIERILYTRMAGKPVKDIFRELYQAKTYLADRGSSPKMLLEHIAMVTPPSP